MITNFYHFFPKTVKNIFSYLIKLGLEEKMNAKKLPHSKMAVDFLTVLPQPPRFLGVISVACLKPIKTLKEIGEELKAKRSELPV